jgi:glycosyltransferase involved in cell wall biosynthesis
VRVLVVCYKIAAGEGSESGSGYNFVKELAPYCDELVVVTRGDHATALTDDPELRHVQFVPYDVPRGLSWWKKGPRGVIPYYYLWQVGVGRLVARLHATRPFDVLHQYNFHADWSPHFLRAEGARLVWGPICHQPRTPAEYLRLDPSSSVAKETAKWMTKRAFWSFDPFLRAAIRRTDVILYANADVARPFARSGKVQQQTFGGASFIAGRRMVEVDNGPLRLLHVGRTVGIKGALVAVEALALCQEGAAAAARLVLVGDGPMRKPLEREVQRMGMAHRITFVPWTSQAELAQHYGSADAFLYPSLGNQDTVVAEALAAGLPVIAAETTGTATMAADAGLTGPRQPYGALLEGLAARVSHLAEAKAADPRSLLQWRARALDRAGVVSWPATASAIARRYG